MVANEPAWGSHLHDSYPPFAHAASFRSWNDQERRLRVDSRLSTRDNHGRGCLRQFLQHRPRPPPRAPRGGFPNRRLGLELLGKCQTFTNASLRGSRFESPPLHQRTCHDFAASLGPLTARQPAHCSAPTRLPPTHKRFPFARGNNSLTTSKEAPARSILAKRYARAVAINALLFDRYRLVATIRLLRLHL